MNEDTIKIKDFSWTFILPSICLFGFFTNLINIIVFLKLKSKNPIYKLMLSNSISNFFYSLICFFVFIMRCGQYCTIQNTYWVKIYEKYLFYYLTSVLGLFNIFIEVCVAIQRYMIVANKSLPKKLPIRLIILVLFILSLVLYTPNMFYRQIISVKNHNSTSFIIQTSNDQYIAKLILTVISGMRGLLILFLLLIINLLLLHRFKYQVEKKKHIKTIRRTSDNDNTINKKHDGQHLMTPEQHFTRATSVKSLRTSGKGNDNDLRAKKNMTRMVIWMSIFFFIGNLLNSLSFYILEFTQNSFIFITYYVLISNSLLFTSHGINIFFYYFFNKNYRNIFKDNKIFKLFK
jgi:hypothetical protein